MPSIPQSLLWISLVVLWLFVLVPMLVSKRDAVRRTSDVALATRVLTSGPSARLLKRGGPAAGHRSDPDWRAEGDEFGDLDEGQPTEPSATRAVVAATDEQTEPDYLDVDVIDEDSGALPVGAETQAETEADRADAASAEAGEEAGYQTEDVDEDDSGSVAEAEYHDVEDTSGLQAEEEPAPSVSSVGTPRTARRRRYDMKTAAAVSARKYEFRKRTLMAMALVLVLSALVAFTVAPSVWWLCGSAAGVTVLYLAYLRRQTRIEAQVRARRMRRMERAFNGDNVGDEGFEVVPSRLRRPGAAVLEIDDEDPTFEHLDYVPFAREYGWHGDLPRAAGQ